MKAAYRTHYCSSHELTVQTIEKPQPKADELLIKVHATTVNRTDCAVLAGKPFIMRFFTGLSKPTSPVPGTDFAGEVVALGKSVNDYKIGDRIMGFRDDGLGSQADYFCISTKVVMTTIPENIDYQQAAASLEGAHYAINFFKYAPVKAGQKVLLNGATGAIGSVLLQLLKNRGCHVTAVCNTKNIDLIRSLGADKIYDYEKEDFTKDSGQYAYVFDAVGKSSFSKCKHLLAPKGIYISSELGDRFENPFLALISPLMPNKKVKFPIPTDIRKSVAQIREMLEKGVYQPVIDRTYPLAEISEAYQYVEQGLKTGNVVILMG